MEKEDIPASMAMIVMTITSSIIVNPVLLAVIMEIKV
jgi:hypothetical protein